MRYRGRINGAGTFTDFERGGRGRSAGDFPGFDRREKTIAIDRAGLERLECEAQVARRVSMPGHRGTPGMSLTL